MEVESSGPVWDVRVCRQRFLLDMFSENDLCPKEAFDCVGRQAAELGLIGQTFKERLFSLTIFNRQVVLPLIRCYRRHERQAQIKECKQDEEGPSIVVRRWSLGRYGRHQ